MATVKLNIEEIRIHLFCIRELGKEKLPFVFAFSKSLTQLEKAEKEWLEDAKKLRESFYEYKEDSKEYKQYLCSKDGDSIKLVRDTEGKLQEAIADGTLEKGQFLTTSVPDSRLEEFLKDYKKLEELKYEVKIHQILEKNFEDACTSKSNLKGESVDANLVTPLVGTLFVDLIEG